MSAPGDKQKSEESKVDWQTPPELFSFLNGMYSFSVDGAASAANALLPHYYTEELNAFLQCPVGEWIFVNPPYGGLMPWMHLFLQWMEAGDNLVVALVPAAPDTEWWNFAYRTASETILLGPSRVKFIDPVSGNPGNSNTVASCIFVWDKQVPRTGYVQVWDWRRDVFRD